jgi:hypothetical protein
MTLSLILRTENMAVKKYIYFTRLRFCGLSTSKINEDTRNVRQHLGKWNILQPHYYYCTLLVYFTPSCFVRYLLDFSKNISMFHIFESNCWILVIISAMTIESHKYLFPVNRYMVSKSLYSAIIYCRIYCGK